LDFALIVPTLSAGQAHASRNLGTRRRCRLVISVCALRIYRVGSR
jgi:hypothetical protein